MSKKRDLPDNITAPYAKFLQVRIVRAGHEFSSTFPFRNYSSPEEASADAEAWRDDLLSKLPPPENGRGSFRRRPMKGKKSFNRVGITRYVKYDNRRAGRPGYLVFGVNYTDSNDVSRIRQFQVGRVEEVNWEKELHASKTAEGFRMHWEYCKEAGLDFDPDAYKGWAEKCFYPFTPMS